MVLMFAWFVKVFEVLNAFSEKGYKEIDTAYMLVTTVIVEGENRLAKTDIAYRL